MKVRVTVKFEIDSEVSVSEIQKIAVDHVQRMLQLDGWYIVGIQDIFDKRGHSLGPAKVFEKLLPD